MIKVNHEINISNKTRELNKIIATQKIDIEKLSHECGK